MSEERRSRAYVTEAAKTMGAAQDEGYITRDLNALQKLFDDKFNELDEAVLASLDLVANGDEKAKRMSAAVSCKKETWMRTKDKDGNTLSEPVPTEFVRYSVYVNVPKVGISVGFQPEIRRGKLTMGQMTILQRDDDGKLVYEKVVGPDGKEKDSVVKLVGKEECISATCLDENDEPIKGSENLIAVLEALGGLESIKDMSLQGRSKGSFKPFYVSKSTQEVLDNEEENFDDERVDYYQGAVDKLSALAQKIFDAANKSGISIQYEQEDQNTHEKVTKTASLRLSVDKRMLPVVKVDEKGEPILNEQGKKQYEQKKNGKGTKMVPAKDENGKEIYDSSIELVGTGLKFNVDVAKEEALITSVERTTWAGKVATRLFGTKQIEEKAPDDIKAYVKAVSEANLFRPFTQREGGDSAIWTLYQKVSAEVNEKSEDWIKDGAVSHTESGNVRKEEYVSYNKEFKRVELRSRVEGESNMIVSLYESNDKKIHANYIKFSEVGGTTKGALTKDNLDVLVKSDVIKEIVKENVSDFLEKTEKQVERD